MKIDENFITKTAELKTQEPIAQSASIVFPHQADAYHRLVLTAEAFARENWHSLAVTPRWHALLLAPSGVGKSHIANQLSLTLGWPIYSIYTSRWVIAGGRGERTWQEIATWLSRQEGKCLIFLDEVDKLHSRDSWSTHLRTEVFSLLDRQLPLDLEIDDTDSKDSKVVLWAKARKVLKCDTLIIAAGAFQHLWENRPKTLGFGSDDSGSGVPSLAEIRRELPTELVNRFGRIVALPYLTETDYRNLAKTTGSILPLELQQRFWEIAKRTLPGAVRDAKGVRYIEECVTETLLESAAAAVRAGHTAISPSRMVAPDTTADSDSAGKTMDENLNDPAP
jgi:SpoVK/Ycf46/Vps4 family AAA+-type ATPase